MLLIYTPKLCNRIKYIFKVFFSDILDVEYAFTENTEEYLAYEGPAINYSTTTFEKGIFFHSENLLHERGIDGQEIVVIDDEGNPAFFPVYDHVSAMPFDPFAAAFYLITRYEEYLPYVKDEHGRFQAKDSLAFKNGFLHKPIVNIWAQQIKSLLLKQFPGMKMPEQRFQFIPSIDINAAYAMRSKGLVRTIGGYLKSVGDLDFGGMLQRTKVIMGTHPDPIDTYKDQLELQKKYDLKTIYFILFADYGHNDKNISVNSRRFQVLIKSLADYCKVGLHSSFSSIRDPDLLQIELNRLSKVLNREISKIRQHFLVLNMPVTYRNMVNLDISDDYSMGYVNHPGFRAGISNAFNFYDLDLDVETKLRIHPFAILDVDIQSDISPMEQFRQIRDEVKKVNATLISMWSNDALVKNPGAPFGLTFYEKMIQMILT